MRNLRGPEKFRKKQDIIKYHSYKKKETEEGRHKTKWVFNTFLSHCNFGRFLVYILLALVVKTEEYSTDPKKSSMGKHLVRVLLSLFFPCHIRVIHHTAHKHSPKPLVIDLARSQSTAFILASYKFHDWHKYCVKRWTTKHECQLSRPAIFKIKCCF